MKNITIIFVTLTILFSCAPVGINDSPTPFSITLNNQPAGVSDRETVSLDFNLTLGDLYIYNDFQNLEYENLYSHPAHPFYIRVYCSFEENSYLVSEHFLDWETGTREYINMKVESELSFTTYKVNRDRDGASIDALSFIDLGDSFELYLEVWRDTDEPALAVSNKVEFTME